MRLVSLFAGIGGFDLGFSRAGARIVAHVEKDANCRKLLQARWPGAVCLDDVCTAGRRNLPDCDVICFGFPCQDLSVAGKREGLAGERSGLYYEATRIIDELQPSFCLFENVSGLLSSDDGRDFARVLMEMDRIGYAGAWRVLDAQWFGVAQRRRRVFGLFTRLDSGAERCAEILSIRESLRGHPPPSREAGQGAAENIGECFTPSCHAGYRKGIGTLRANGGDLGGGSEALIPAVAGCLQTTANDYSRADSFNMVPCYGIDSQQNARIDLMGTLDTQERGNRNAMVATPWDGQRARKEVGGPEGAVAFGGDVARTLSARHDSSPCADRGMDVVAVPVAMRESGQGFWMEDEKAGTLRAEGENRPSRPSNVVAVPVAQVQWASGGGKVHNPTAQALRSGAEHNYQFAQVGMQVRRLTPTECERLQGFPDGWTEGFSDSCRYRMLGNAVAVPCAEWIARRLTHAQQGQQAGKET